MANIKSAKKRVLVNAKKAEDNKAVRSDLKTALKKANFALENKEDSREETVKVAVRKIDSAARKGIIHMNNAAHKKSKLVKKLNKLV